MYLSNNINENGAGGGLLLLLLNERWKCSGVPKPSVNGVAHTHKRERENIGKCRRLHKGKVRNGNAMQQQQHNYYTVDARFL